MKAIVNNSLKRFENALHPVAIRSVTRHLDMSCQFTAIHYRQMQH